MNKITIDPKLYHGKPADERLPRETAVYELLDSLEIPYTRLDHEAAGHVEYCDEIGKFLDVEICKNLFLCNRQKTDFYLLMMPGKKEFRTKELSKQIGCSRLSFADPEFMEQYLRVTPGSVSVMGLMNDKEKRVRLLMDRDVMESEFIGCHPCINTSSLKIATVDLFRKFLPFVEHSATVVAL